MPAGTYEFAYAPGTPYAHAVRLVSRWRRPEGVVLVDLGCGYGAIAEPVLSLGLAYLGVDMEPSGVRSIVERGGEGMVGDLAAPDALFNRLDEVLKGRPVAAITMLDAVEHLADALGFLRALSRYARELGEPPLVVSIPNVSHRDVAIKLLLGRWDVTPTGLLDATHLRFFSPGALASAMTGAGWHEVDALDFDLEVSDQHFPSDCVALEPGTPVGSMLHGLRQNASYGATTNQFVRAYLPQEAAAPLAAPHDEEGARPFLTVVVRTGASRGATLEELLLSLAAQDSGDYEVVVVVPPAAPPDARRPLERALAEHDAAFRCRVRVETPTLDAGQPWGPAAAANAGVAVARGRYVVVLDDDQVAFGGWVRALASAAAAHPGRAVHAGVATQRVVATPGLWQRAGGPPSGTDGYDVVDRPRLAGSFDVGLPELLSTPSAPLCGVAIPRSFFVDLGERFDDDMGPAGDWELLVRAVGRCGVSTSGVVGVLRREWVQAPGDQGSDPGDPASAAAWERAWAKLDHEPLLLDRHGASRLAGLASRAGLGSAVGSARGGEVFSTYDALSERVRSLAAANADAEARLADMRASTSWRVTAPLRAFAGWMRRR
jgi:2-polyprenyl-3-methyl-5-hydroxy-6-metoxy-1,4-benzoquinol methylase